VALPILTNSFPNKYVTCPCCEGTGRTKPTEGYEKYKRSYADYDEATDTLPCKNCGGQTMSGRASGYTLPNPQTGVGCKHEFVGRNAGRCYTVYVCKHCSSQYDIDSSD